MPLARPIRIPAGTVREPLGGSVIALHEMWLITRADGISDVVPSLDEALRFHVAR